MFNESAQQDSSPGPIKKDGPPDSGSRVGLLRLTKRPHPVLATTSTKTKTNFTLLKNSIKTTRESTPRLQQGSPPERGSKK